MFGLFKRKKDDTPVYSAYNLIVAQARQPVLYLDYQVPDTAEGRFENIVLHIFLILHRLKRENEEIRGFGQELFDLFFADMDRSLREAGVGDVSVPKKIKKMAEAFYGRVKAYDEALEASGQDMLKEKLGRFIYTEAPSEDVLSDFAIYISECVSHLDGQKTNEILAGQISFPAPRPRS